MPSQLGPTECPASGLTSRMIDTGTAAFAYTFISAISSNWEPDEGDDRAARWVEHRDMVLEYAKRPGEEWLRDMMEKAKAERFAAKECD